MPAEPASARTADGGSPSGKCLKKELGGKTAHAVSARMTGRYSRHPKRASDVLAVPKKPAVRAPLASYQRSPPLTLSSLGQTECRSEQDQVGSSQDDEQEAAKMSVVQVGDIGSGEGRASGAVDRDAEDGQETHEGEGLESASSDRS